MSRWRELLIAAQISMGLVMLAGCDSSCGRQPSPSQETGSKRIPVTATATPQEDLEVLKRIATVAAPIIHGVQTAVAPEGTPTPTRPPKK